MISHERIGEELADTLPLESGNEGEQGVRFGVHVRDSRGNYEKNWWFRGLNITRGEVTLFRGRAVRLNPDSDVALLPETKQIGFREFMDLNWADDRGETTRFGSR